MQDLNIDLGSNVLESIVYFLIVEFEAMRTNSNLLIRYSIPSLSLSHSYTNLFYYPHFLLSTYKRFEHWSRFESTVYFLILEFEAMRTNSSLLVRYSIPSLFPFFGPRPPPIFVQQEIGMQPTDLPIARQNRRGCHPPITSITSCVSHAVRRKYIFVRLHTEKHFSESRFSISYDREPLAHLLLA